MRLASFFMQCRDIKRRFKERTHQIRDLERNKNNMEALIGAGASIIVGVLSLVGVVITNNNSNKKIQSQLETQQAVTDCKIDELTREVREHNNFAKRMPVVEEMIKVANHRIDDLEQETKELRNEKK